MSRKDDLPKLQGNAEQVAAATKIRDNFFAEFERIMERTKSLDRQMMKKDREKAKIFGGLAGILSDLEPIFATHFAEITDSQYWIDNQDKNTEELLMKQIPAALFKMSSK